MTFLEISPKLIMNLKNTIEYHCKKYVHNGKSSEQKGAHNTQHSSVYPVLTNIKKQGYMQHIFAMNVQNAWCFLK